MSEKYVVFKRSDWNELLISHREHVKSFQVEDAEVIRHQDITAAPIFSTYAHMIISFRDLLYRDQPGVPPGWASLTEIADYFAAAADKAEAYPNKRLPD